MADAFRAFLSDWRAALQVRLDEAVDEVASVPSVLGVVIGGSMGGGAPWPLSDIDLLPIHRNGHATGGRQAVEGVRQSLLARWSAQGVRTPLDVGWLSWEVDAALAEPPAALVGRCGDARWPHAADKAFGGRGVGAGCGGQLAAGLAEWPTAARFLPSVVADRARRAWLGWAVARRRLPHVWPCSGARRWDGLWPLGESETIRMLGS